MIKFYCEKCGKQLWERANWNDISHMTLDLVKELLVCSDCMLKDIHEHRVEQQMQESNKGEYQE